MKIADVEEGGIVFLLKNESIAPKTVVNRFVVANTNLIDWYPLYKSAEYRYDKEQDIVNIHRNWKDEIASPIGKLSSKEVKLSPAALSAGFSPEVAKENHWIAEQAQHYFNLSDGTNFHSLKDAKDGIAKIVHYMDTLFNQLAIRDVYGEYAMDDVDDNDLKLEILGGMYNLYQAYVKVFKAKE